MPCLACGGSALEKFMQLATEQVSVHGATENSIAASSNFDASKKTPEELANIAARFASSDGWLDRVRLRVEHRWYERLHHDSDYDIWVISWMPGQSTGFHDHGESAGAFVVTTGILEEKRPGEEAVVIHPGTVRAFGPDYLHDVRNVSHGPAVSIHVYSPPLTEMNEYELDGDQLIPREPTSERAETLEQRWRSRKPATATKTVATSIDQMLMSARARLRRLSPSEAFAASEAGAIIVDIRPEGQRLVEGGIVGALIVERNVLEWRFDPTSSARLPVATNHDSEVIVFCSEGYTSSLAAATLQDLGLWRATDITGGFNAWSSSGLPIIPPSKSS
jgi:rhodanese-related sulfurtransferase/mannose-6-phosphate isomerase-like protein (cupin superfamily)